MVVFLTSCHICFVVFTALELFNIFNKVFNMIKKKKKMAVGWMQFFLFQTNFIDQKKEKGTMVEGVNVKQ